jgi:hypothetical protein
VVLLDQDSWEVSGSMRGRPCLPCPQWNGAYGGLPADASDAATAVTELTASGSIAVAVAWPAFWWLEYYGLGALLADQFRCVAETPDVHVYLK